MNLKNLPLSVLLCFSGLSAGRFFPMTKLADKWQANPEILFNPP